MLRRRPGLDIAIIEPADRHFYQPGWTLVGCGVFSADATMRPMASVMPKGVRWQRIAVTAFEPEHDRVVLADGTRLAYRVLVAAPGLKLDWDAIPGLNEALGKNGVTSNYRFDLAPYNVGLGRRYHPLFIRLGRNVDIAYSQAAGRAVDFPCIRYRYDA